jgi:hypothetical protein
MDKDTSAVTNSVTKIAILEISMQTTQKSGDGFPYQAMYILNIAISIQNHTKCQQGHVYTMNHGIRNNSNRCVTGADV